VSDWSTVFLAVIAVATGVMALVQIGAVISVLRLVRRVSRLVERINREIDPLLGKVQEMSDDAARATKLAVGQVERADDLMAGLAQRAEETLDIAQQLLLTPVRQGLSFIDGLRTIFSSRPEPKETRSEEAKTKEEDESVFMG